MKDIEPTYGSQVGFLLLQGFVSRFDKLGLDEAETEGLLYRCTHFFSTFLFLNVFVGASFVSRETW